MHISSEDIGYYDKYYHTPQWSNRKRVSLKEV